MGRGTKILFYTAFLLALSVFIFSGWKIFSYYRSSYEAQSRYEELADMVKTAQTDTAQPETVQTEPTLSTADQPPAGTEPTPEREILSEYQALHEINPHMVGWIQIEGTIIDYPVVQTPEDPEYYLDRNFDGLNTGQGCIFADGACDVENSDNVTLYGHHMNDGSMFAALKKYTSRAFWEQYPILRFDSLTQHRTYQVFAVFCTSANIGQGFAYHTFVDADDETEFADFIAQCKTLSLYDTGITPQYGDQILCLSTCEYSQDNGRLVVAAVLIDE